MPSNISRKLFSTFLISILIFQTIVGVFTPLKLSLTPPFFKTQEVWAAGENWYNFSWSHRKAITITGSTAGAQTNYQVNVSVTYSSSMKSDFSDIRFTDSDGTTLLSHWLETKTDSATATFWVKIPSIPASPSAATIYMYYGNASAVSASSGDNTFNFFDDFNNVLLLNPVMSPSQTWELSGTNPANRWGSIAYLNGTYYIYYVNKATTYGIGRAISTDLKTWVKDSSNPIISNIAAPSVLKSLDGQTPISYGGKYWMTTAPTSGTKMQIRSASAIDSNTWTVENDTAVVPTPSTWYSSQILSNSFVEEGSTFYIFFQGYNGTTWKIGYATSSAPAGPYTVQGISLQPSLGWEGSYVVDPEMRKFGSTYYLFYSGNGGSSCYNSYATSTSLTGTYTKSNILLTPQGLSYPAILFNSNDSYYYLLGDNLASGAHGKDLYKRADLNGAFSGAVLSSSNWAAGNNLSFANSILTLGTGGGGFIKSAVTFGLNTALRTKAAFAAYANYLQIGYNNDTGATTANSVGFFGYNTPTVKAISSSNVIVQGTTLGTQGIANHTWEITRRSGENKFYEDGTIVATHTTDVTTSALPILAENTAGSGGELDIDWMLVRNFVSPEPILGVLGSEESLDHFVITGSSSQTAGSSQTITITANTNLGNTYTAYTGDKSFTFSGANAYSGGSNPTCSDKTNADIPFGTTTTLTFTNGIATCTLKLYKVESASITATDGTYNANSNYLAVTVTDVASPSSFTLSSPVNNDVVSAFTNPTFSWNASSDVESGLAKYQLFIDNVLDTDNISSSVTSVVSTNALSCDAHTWYVKAIDNAGNSTSSDTFNLSGICRRRYVEPDPTPTLSPSPQPSPKATAGEATSSSTPTPSPAATAGEATPVPIPSPAPTPIPSNTPYPQLPSFIFTQTLQLGSHNTQVTALQDKLKQLNFFPQGTQSNGNFGPATRQAVMDYQKSKGIYPNGIVGPRTRKALNNEEFITNKDYQFTQDLKYNDKNEEVKQLQTRLRDQNFFPYNVSSTGWFGSITEKAINLFQGFYDLVKNGIVDPAVREVLNR